jgi:hypothetical protein
MLFTSLAEFANQYYDDSFVYTVGVTPLSNWYTIAFGIIMYLGSAFLLGRLNLHLNLTYFKCIHNLFLSGFSLVMFSGTLFEVASLIATHGTGPFELICDPQHQYNKGRLYFWIWLFHLSKWYEDGWVCFLF